MVVPTYKPRWFGRLDTWRFSDWAIKVYGISTEAPDQKLVIDQGLVKEAHSFVKANLARMEETSHYSVGFVILHHGSAAKSLLTQVAMGRDEPVDDGSVRQGLYPAKEPGAGKRGMTQLRDAAYAGDIDGLRRALAAGLDVNAPDSYRGYTPLHWLADMAATGGPRLEMLELLVGSGADINKPALDGTTALVLAREAGSVGGDELAAVLLKLGAHLAE